MVAVLMVVLAGCGSPYGGGSDKDSSNGRDPNGGGSTSGSGVVVGHITNRDTGRPYPHAYVRFAWLVDASDEDEIHTVTDAGGRYAVELPAGQYRVTAGDSCDLNAGFAIVGKAPDDVMITVPEASEVDFVEYPITEGADLPGVC